MNDDFSSRLQEHFNKHDEANADKAKRSQESNAKLKESRDKFVKVARATIEPTLNKARDFLLNRNFPAVVVYETGERVGKTDGYIALHCSNNIQDARTIEARAMFRIEFTFTAYDEKIAVRADTISPKNLATILELNETTQPKIEKIIFDFLQICFPNR
jgi:hypothetical protein